MSLLEGKNALVFGVANNRSIAWGIVQALHKHGAKVGVSYAGEIFKKRIDPLAEKLGITFIEECDVSDDANIKAIVKKAEAEFGKIDIVVHAIAFANRDELNGPYYDTSREGFRVALDISVYSFTALAREFLPIMRPGGSFLTMTYYGSDKVTGSYNVMGVAKAALESSVRYLAHDLGKENIRVNAISAGPIRTLSAAGVATFRSMYRQFIKHAPLKQNIDIEDVGNAAVFLSSALASKITGEIMFVDSGFNIMGIPTEDITAE